MIETITQQIIADLGPTGILVLTLYFIFKRCVKDLGSELRVYTKEVQCIRQILESLLIQYAKINNGKN